MGSYIYGAPENLGSWNHVASIFAAHDSVFSDETSSLPLVKFWQPKEDGEKLTEEAKTLLQQCELNPDDFSDAKFCFEYPVPVGKGRGKASMTDLMIITDKHAIAVEAKWTERKDAYQTIDAWLESADKENNRYDVLDGWIDYINKYLGVEEIQRDNTIGKKILYQMLHRIASACQVATSLQPNAQAVVVYQLFYNAETTGNKVDFIDCLKRGYKELFGDGKAVPLRIIETEVEKDIPEKIKRQCKTDQGKYDWNELFRLMQTNRIYKFPLTRIRSVSVND